MGKRNPALNWDRLLDGGTYVLDIRQIGWQSSINDLRAKAHYEADKRIGRALTHKVSNWSLEVRGEVERGKPQPSGPCSCGAPPHDFHVITCTSLGANATPVIGRSAPGTTSTPQEQPPTMTVEPEAEELSAADIEALLGPCSCGQAPICLPTCTRVTG